MRTRSRNTLDDVLSPSSLLINLRRSRKLSQIFQIHGRLIVVGLAADSFFTSRILLAIAELSPQISSAAAMYADIIFSNADLPNAFIWNTIIRIHAGSDDARKSIAMFCGMRRRGICTDQYTYPFLLKSCGLFSGWGEGRQIHAEILRRGWGSQVFVANALISFCWRCGKAEEARKLFDGLICRDLVSWNTMISGYAAVGRKNDALELFEEMPGRDAFSYAIAIDVCGKIGDADSAEKLFRDVSGRADGDLVTWNSMIAAYAGAGRMEEARKLFDSMANRTVVSWSVIIDGYSRHGNAEEALNLFRRMLSEGIRTDKIAATAAISACTKLGSLEQARWIHRCIQETKIPLDLAIQTALVDMYMKCGSVEDARLVFDVMPEKNAISWNVMILGLGASGYASEALDLFHAMEKDNQIAMDDVTYLAALTICANSGRLEQGLAIFERTERKSDEHLACVADLLGRAGKIEEAMEMLEKTPRLCGILLEACRVHRRVDLAEICLQKLEEIGEDDADAHVMVSNLYAECGRWEGVWAAREKMRRRRMKKEAGKSTVEVC